MANHLNETISAHPLPLSLAYDECRDPNNNTQCLSSEYFESVCFLPRVIFWEC